MNDSHLSTWILQLRTAGTQDAFSTALWAIEGLAKPQCKANLPVFTPSVVRRSAEYILPVDLVLLTTVVTGFTSWKHTLLLNHTLPPPTLLVFLGIVSD